MRERKKETKKDPKEFETLSKDLGGIDINGFFEFCCFMEDYKEKNEKRRG